MRKEYILTEEEKMRKRMRIEENRCVHVAFMSEYIQRIVSQMCGVYFLHESGWRSLFLSLGPLIPDWSR